MRPAVLLMLLTALSRLGAVDGAQLATQPPLEPGTGAISGVVLDAQSGLPLAGAVVYLGVTGRGPIGRISRQLTDPKGRFVFLDLPAHDQFFINASRFGYMNGGYGTTPVRSAPTRIKLADGEWLKDAKILLWPPAAINGRVLDERGEPVVGVPVRVLAQILVGGRPQTAAGPGTITDDRGAYRIADLRPGRYIVQVPSVQSAVPAGVEPTAASGSAVGAPETPRAAIDGPGGFRSVVGDYALPPPAVPRALVYPIAYHPAARNASEAVPVDLSFGDDRTNLDLTLAPVPAATIAGTVQGPPDALSGLMLRLLPEGAEDMGRGSEAATSLVDATGRFAFLNVPAGSYTIDARRTMAQFEAGSAGSSGSIAPPTPPGFMFSSMSSSSVASAPRGTSITMHRATGAAAYWARAAVTVDGRDVDGVTILMQRGVTLTGRFAWDGASVPPANARGLHVTAEPANGNAALGLPTSAFGRPPGEPFTVEGLLPGRYTLRVFGQAAWLVKSITWNGEDHTYTGFDASSGRDIEGVLITFTDKAPRLSGLITGEAPESAVAIAFPVERELWTGSGLTPPRIRTAVADTSGEYRFSQLPAGEYFVVAVTGDEMYGWQDPKFLELAQAHAARVSIGWGETKTQNLRVVRVR